MSKIVIATLYQLGRMDGKTFTKEMKVAKRTDVAVERDFADRINEQWENNGKLYEIDEEKTKVWNEELGKHRDNIETKKRLQAEGAQKLADAILNTSLNLTGSKKPAFAAPGKAAPATDAKAFAVNELFEISTEELSVEEISALGSTVVFFGTNDACLEYVTANKK